MCDCQLLRSLPFHCLKTYLPGETEKKKEKEKKTGHEETEKQKTNGGKLILLMNSGKSWWTDKRSCNTISSLDEPNKSDDKQEDVYTKCHDKQECLSSGTTSCCLKKPSCSFIHSFQLQGAEASFSKTGQLSNYFIYLKPSYLSFTVGSNKERREKPEGLVSVWLSFAQLWKMWT